MGLCVGIDLGTTYSAVAKINSMGKPEIIKNDLGETTTPSIVCIEENGNVIIGKEAKENFENGDLDTMAFYKREMGNDDFVVDIHNKEYKAKDLSAIYLRKLKNDIEKSTGEKIDKVVITVPAYFQNKEREETKEAGRKAGLDVIDIINEPTAAALAYGLNTIDGKQTILIYDLGGGTFDVTLAEIGQNKINIIGTNGNCQLGGKDWDNCLLAIITNKFKEQSSLDITDDDAFMTELLAKAEQFKKELTEKSQITHNINYQGHKEQINITLEEFENASRYLLAQTEDVINEMFNHANVRKTWKDINSIILVGGSTRMKMIKKFIKEKSGKEPLNGVNVDEAVAIGAAIRANMIQQQKLSLPQSKLYIAPKEVQDVTAHALGTLAISSDGKRYINEIMITKNSPIPVEKSKSFYLEGNQNENEIYVLQGEQKRPLDNTIVNKYVVYNIPSLNSNKKEIKITYKYESDGTISVFAHDSKGKELNIRKDNYDINEMGWTDEEAQRSKTVAIYLAPDLSGSMSGDPMQEAINAMTNFSKQLSNENVNMGIIPFADTTGIELHLTNDSRQVQYVIQQLKSCSKYGVGTSANPIEIAYDELRKDDSEIKYIVVLTDGAWFNEDEAINSAKKCKKSNIEIVAIGCGDANQGFLNQIATTKDTAILTNFGELKQTFSKVAQVIGGKGGLTL